MANIGVTATRRSSSEARDPFNSWAWALVDDLRCLLMGHGHLCVETSVGLEPLAIQLLIGVEPASANAPMRADVAIADESPPGTHGNDDASFDLAARLYDILPELGAEPAWPVLEGDKQARAACALRVALPVSGAGDAGARRQVAQSVVVAVEAHLQAMRRRAYGFRIAGAARPRIDLRYEVPLVPQTTEMSCWAAAAAMVVGWRDQIAVDTEEIARGTGGWEAYRAGLQPDDVVTLARVWDLTIEAPRTYASADLETLLRRCGPLWVGQADPDLHVICVVGVSGNGTAEGTLVQVNDPWPPGRGERYSLTLGELAGNFHTAAALVGLHIQILHGNGRRQRTPREGLKVQRSTA